MKIREFDTYGIDREKVERHIEHYCSGINIYGKCNNMFFMLFGSYAGVYDVENNKLIISNRKGIAYPVVDKDNNKYFMVITSQYDDRIYCKYYNQPKYSDTARCYIDDMDLKVLDLDCFCNVYNADNQCVVPMNKYLANIYQFTNMVKRDPFYKTIKYRDIDDENYLSKGEKNYAIYDNLPNTLDEDYEMVFSSYAISDMFWKKHNKKKDENISLNVAEKKGKYSVWDSERNIMISYGANVKNVKIIDNDTIMLQDGNGYSALYDIHRGYLINFEDKISFVDAVKLTQDVFRLNLNSKSFSQWIVKCRYFIKNNVSLDIYDDIYMTSDNLIVCEGFKKIDFYNIDGTLIYGINARNFYKHEEYLFYYEDNKFYCYNFKTGIKTEMEIPAMFKLEDGSDVKLSVDEILEKYKYCYKCNFDEREDFVLLRDRKYGVEFSMEMGIGKKNVTNRLFDSRDDRERYLQLFFESLVDNPVYCSLDSKDVKKKTKKLD